ncbi:MAG: RnfABCDGE type electron transport complex subunit D [Saccharofermentans sp.]|nr:RnfABCDGE type electron transport complex subunit D [Saccharofermentans sp.]
MIERRGAPFIHIDTSAAYQSIARLVALLPIIVGSVYFNGLYAAFLILLCMVTFTASDWICDSIRGSKYVRDLTSPYMGAVFALLLPVDASWIMAVTGVLFGSVVVKQLYGGRGSYFLVPAAMGRLFVRVVFPSIEPDPVDLSGYHLAELFVGRYPSLIGTSCALLIMLGLIYMCVKRVYKIYIPATYVISLSFLLIIKDIVMGSHETVFFMLTSGVLFTAVYLMCDETTFISFGAGAMLEALICAFLTFILSSKVTGVDIIIIPVLITGVFTKIINYARYVLSSRVEDKSL